MTIDNAYPKAGLTVAGTTTPARWSVTPVTSCQRWRARTAPSRAGPTVFTITGTTGDVSFIRVRLAYAAASNPPSRLQCSTGCSGGTFVDC